jgi:hypothetical protein
MSVPETLSVAYPRSHNGDRQMIALELAGTVPLPCPFPALARVNLSLSRLDQAVLEELPTLPPSEQSRFLRQLLVEVVHEVNPRLIMTRLVKLSDLSALFVPDDPRAPEHSRGRWLLSEDLFALALSILEGLDRLDPLPATVPLLDEPAIAYVPETAKLLLRVETGMTAAESAEYYPPMPGDRSHDFRSLIACGP